MSNITFSHALFYQKSLIFTIMLLSGIGNLHNLHVVFYILKKQIDSVHTRNDIGNINSFIRDKHLKRFPLLFSKFI
nr:hypothetical protein [Escherichia coli]